MCHIAMMTWTGSVCNGHLEGYSFFSDSARSHTWQSELSYAKMHGLIVHEITGLQKQLI